jgi:uncharacterized HAD superfamily protein
LPEIEYCCDRGELLVSIKIGLDFDEVIANSHVLKPKLAKEMFGVEISPEDYRREIVLPRGWLTSEQYEAVSREVFSGNHPIEPVKDSLRYIRILLDQGYDLRVVTSRINKALQVSERWMEECELKEIPIVGVGYGVSKVKACHGLDVFVDDDVSKLLPLVGLVKHLLLFSCPQNVRDATPKGIWRVGSWGEVYDYIRYEL